MSIKKINVEKTTGGTPKVGLCLQAFRIGFLLHSDKSRNSIYFGVRIHHADLTHTLTTSMPDLLLNLAPFFFDNLHFQELLYFSHSG